jgi:uncharacterized protein
MRAVVAAFFAGALFAVGLALGGMTQPSKVIGFLDVTGDWDPSLAFVMLGAIGVYMPLYRLIVRRRQPLLVPRFVLPTRTDLDARLVIGGAVFGVGWGLGGYCPGPGIAALGSGGVHALAFAASMVGGMALFRVYDTLRRPSGTPTA